MKSLFNCLFCGGLIGLLVVCSKERSVLQALDRALPAKPIPIHASFVVESDHCQIYSVQLPSGHAKGVLHGHWESRGKSAHFASAADDTLATFTLLNVQNQPVQTQHDATDGVFSLRCEQVGTCCMRFDNSGFFRSSPRVITLDGEFTPD